MPSSKILIVEDNGLVAADLKLLLEGYGYEVPATVASGEKAIQQAASLKVDLVLMDIMLQGEMDGISAAEQIVKECDTPIIFLTAYANEQFYERARKIGPFGYMVKPFREYELRNNVEIALKKHMLQQQLLNNHKELKQSEENFTHIAAHDLKAPLLTFQNASKLLREQYWSQFDETGKKALDYLEEASSRMNGLIDGLLEYRLLDQNPEGLQFISCKEMVDLVVEDLQVKIDQVDVNITYNALPSIWARKNDVYLLFYELIDNAIKFCEKGRQPQIRIWAEEDSTKWQLFISDEGIGIAPKYHKRIFSIFQRLQKRSDYEGLGLGLAFCKKIVEIYQGTITVTSKEGQGSIFSFTIPKSKA